MANSMQQPFDPETSRLIKNKARRLSCRGGFTASDKDDIEQELCLHLWRQASKFDPTIASWLKWASYILDKRCVSILRQHTAERRSRKREECSLNEPVLDTDHHVVDRHQTTAEAAQDFRWFLDLRADIEGLRNRLSEEAWLLHRGMVDGTIAEMAREQHWSRTRVARYRRELRQVCENNNLREYL
jgi:RNA polymerase sigma-70 factor, ECF subfamily